MRILNIVFNAEIKYQQYAKLRKYRHKDFRSNFDPGKTHKGKTSERGIFIIYELLRNFFYSIFIFRNLHKLIWTFFHKNPFEQSWKMLLDFCPRNPYNCTAVPTINVVRTVPKFVPKLC
jgi:hypothetical protein